MHGLSRTHIVVRRDAARDGIGSLATIQSFSSDSVTIVIQMKFVDQAMGKRSQRHAQRRDKDQPH